MTKAQTFVYFLRPIGAQSPIKIGCSYNPAKRLQDYCQWSPVPLEIVATIPGDAKLERNLHDCFADLHSHREWFHTDARLAKFIEEIAAGVPVEQAVDLSNKRGNTRSVTANGRSRHWFIGPRGKLYMSIRLRINHLLKRRAMRWQDVPSTIVEAMNSIRDHGLTDEQRAEIEQFIATARAA